MKRTSILLAAILLSGIAGALASGCGPVTPIGDARTPQATPFPLGARSCPPSTVYTYENFGEPFLRGQCLGCHSSDLPEGSRQNAPVGIDFNSYEDVRAWAVRIYVRAGMERPSFSSQFGIDAPPLVSMPPAGGPVDEDRIRLGDWIACNAPREKWAGN